MSKSADAFRTISEVAEWLDTPAHVLRFWESKFTQVKPVKRAGGRRYYRPADMRLLGGIKKLLHEDGMTIKGAQKILREQGIRHVASLCALSVGEDEDFEDVTIEEVVEADPVDTVVPFTKPVEPAEAVAPDPVEESEVEGAALDDRDPEPEEPLVGDAEIAGFDDVNDSAEEISADAQEATVEDPAPAAEDGAPALPGFLQKSMEDRLEETDVDDAPVDEPIEEAPVEAAMTQVPDHRTFMTLTALANVNKLPSELAQQIAPLAERLRARVG